MRNEIALMPGGTFRAEDYLDDDGISGKPIRIRVVVKVQGDELRVDYSGTNP